VAERGAGWVSSLTCLALLSGVAAALSAQGPPLKCATLLSADELKAATGAVFKDMGPEARHPGETECSWMATGGSGFKSVSVQFYEPGYVNESPSKTLAAFFTMLAEPGEGQKAEPLAGTGVKATLVHADPQFLAVVQRADGVARIVANNLTKAQISAVAKAVATP